MKKQIIVFLLSIALCMLFGHCDVNLKDDNKDISTVDSINNRAIRRQYFTVIAKYQFLSPGNFREKFHCHDSSQIYLEEYSNLLSTISLDLINKKMKGVTADGIIVDPFIQIDVYEALNSYEFYERSQLLYDSIQNKSSHRYLDFLLRTLILNKDALISKENIVYLNTPEVISILSLLSNTIYLHLLENCPEARLESVSNKHIQD